MTIADAPARLAAAADASLRWHPGRPLQPAPDPGHPDARQRRSLLLFAAGRAMDGVHDAGRSGHAAAHGGAARMPGQAAAALHRCAGVGSRFRCGPGRRSPPARTPRTTGRRLTRPSSTPRSPAWSVDARRRNPAVRLPSTGRMVDALVPTILEQKVTVIEARRGYRYLMYRYGTPAPGAGTAAPGRAAGPAHP